MAMKYTELADHLHALRDARGARAKGSAMRVAEAWACVLESDQTDINDLRWFDVPMGGKVDGLFARVKAPSGEPVGIILTDNSLPKHWKEFVIIKEMMHCFSPPATFVATPADATALLDGLISSTERYSASVLADNKAILAAAEVILPHYQADWHIAVEHDHSQIAAHHGLHPEIVSLICRIDVLHYRRNGDFA